MLVWLGEIWILLLVMLHYFELCLLPYIQMVFRSELLYAMVCEWLKISWRLVMDLLAMGRG